MLLFALATLQLPTRPFRPLDRPGRGTELVTGLPALCPDSITRDRAALRKSEQGLAESLRRQSADAAPWLALACVRARLDLDGAIAPDGLLMVAGNSWATGAQRAALEVLKRQPGNRRAAALLSLVALSEDEPDDLPAALAVIHAAALIPGAAPATLRACSELALRVHDDSTARRCATRALSVGVDSNWQLLRLVQVDFRAADTAQGMALFQRAAMAAYDSTARQEVDWHLQWFLTPVERVAWDSVTARHSGAWLQDHLATRDIRDGQPFGARLAEHFSRLEYVEANFRLRVARIMRKALLTAPAIGELGGSPLEPDPILEQGVPEPGDVAARSFRDYLRWQTDYDDRGVVWLRFGRPDDQMTWSCSPASQLCTTTKVVREVWKYSINGQVMLLSFEGEGLDGSVGATRLVSGVLGTYLCWFDVLRCQRTTESQHGVLRPEALQQLRMADIGFIQQATTTDDNSPRGTTPINLTARVSQLWNPVSDTPIALVTYAVADRDLAIQETDTVPARVRFELRQWSAAHDSWRDTSWTLPWSRTAAMPTNLAHTGFTVVAGDPTASWSLVATEATAKRALVTGTADTRPADPNIDMSDLILGAASQRLVFRLNDLPIPLAAGGALNRAEPASLYYQVKSTAARTGLRASAAWYRNANSATDTAAVLTMAYDQQLHPGINENQLEMDLTRLQPGDYRLQIRTLDADGRVLASRDVTVRLE
ncbi:MAG TPA: hypothetical protein VGM77_07565 [Gemmatimonadales bacterium]|jgi:hypothetical protein